MFTGISLVIQWLRICLSKAGEADSIRGWGTKILHAVWLGQWTRKKDDRNRMRDMERTTQMENQCDSDRVRWGDREIQRETLRVCVTRMADPQALRDTPTPASLANLPPPAPPTDPTGQVCGNGYICHHIMQMSS